MSPAASAKPQAERPAAAADDRRRWLRLFLLLPPVLCALGGFLAGERMRENRRLAQVAEIETAETFSAERMVPLGRVAMPIDGATAMTLTVQIDVAMDSNDAAYATRRGSDRAQIKDAVILSLADAMLSPGVQENLGDVERLAGIIVHDLRQNRPELAGVRLSGLEVVDANGAAVDLRRLSPGS